MDQHAVHAVEGDDRSLSLVRSDARFPVPAPPILLLHGFGSSARQNWVVTGWVRFLNQSGRNGIMVDLPAHGDSPAPVDAGAYVPSRLRAAVLRALTAERVVPLRDGDPASGVDVIGYSFGARLAWELGAAAPGLFRRMVLGGPGTADPLATFDLAGAERFLAGGPAPADPVTADLLRMAQRNPGTDTRALLVMVGVVKTEPFDPRAAVPSMPVLLVAGDRDAYAAGLEDLGRWAPQAKIVILPGRTHADAVTSRAFKAAALDFIA